MTKSAICVDDPSATPNAKSILPLAAIVMAVECLTVTGSEISDFGGSSLEPPRRWLGAQWLGFALGVLSRPEPPGAPCGGTGGHAGALPGRAL